MKLKVVNDNILVAKLEKEFAVEGEFIIRGIVKEIGQGIMVDGKLTPMQIRPQNIVQFDIRRATQLIGENDNLYVLSQNNILVVEED